jgi:hypothetical protein
MILIVSGDRTRPSGDAQHGPLCAAQAQDQQLRRRDQRHRRDFRPDEEDPIHAMRSRVMHPSPVEAQLFARLAAHIVKEDYQP